MTPSLGWWTRSMLCSSTSLKLREQYPLLSRLQVTISSSWLLTIHILGGSLTATPATANETAASLLLDQLKIVSLNTKATTSVANQLAAVLATETGTETSGNLLISGEQYVALVAMFVERLEANMVGTSITTLSHSISSVMTTLNEDQVKFTDNIQKPKY